MQTGALSTITPHGVSRPCRPAVAAGTSASRAAPRPAAPPATPAMSPPASQRGSPPAPGQHAASATACNNPYSATKPLSACSGRPLCPRLTRVTKAISMVPAKPSPSACTGAAPTGQPSAAAACSNNAGTSHTKLKCSMASSRFCKLARRPQRALVYARLAAISSASTTSSCCQPARLAAASNTQPASQPCNKRAGRHGA